MASLPRLFSQSERPRSPIGLEDVRIVALATVRRMSKLGCPVFDNKIPTKGWYENYIKSSRNIVLIEDGESLPGNVKGVVVKRNHFRAKDEEFKNIYIIVISDAFSDELERCYTIAHEIGHVLMHGPILVSGMAVKRNSHNWHAQDHKLHYLMELEANVVALFSLIPSSVISAAKAVTVTDEGVDPSHVLRLVLRAIYDSDVDPRMVEERIFLQDIVRQNSSKTSELLRFAKFATSRPTWALDGFARRRPEDSAPLDENAWFCAEKTLVSLARKSLLSKSVSSHSLRILRKMRTECVD